MRPSAMPASSTAPVRKVIVRVTIGSFSVAALMGIAALLGAGSFGDTEGRILLTTLLVGVVSIAVLCYLATAGLPSQPVGVAGGVAVLVPFVTGLLMTWGDVQQGPGEGVLRTFGVGAIVAGTLAQASLLLPLARSAASGVRRLLAVTLFFAAVLALMTSAMVLGADTRGDGFYRVLGVVAILDVLGTVVVAALARFGGADPRARHDEPPAAPAVPALTPELQARLDAFVSRTGRSREETVQAALEQYLAAAE